MGTGTCLYSLFSSVFYRTVSTENVLYKLNLLCQMHTTSILDFLLLLFINATRLVLGSVSSCNRKDSSPSQIPHLMSFSVDTGTLKESLNYRS